MRRNILILSFLAIFSLQAQQYNESKFEQIDPLLPTPNVYRTGSGAPGYQYWQQQADYDIKVSLDDAKQTITGSETITYYNNSPDVLNYIWLQLDQNMRAKDSDTYKTSTNSLSRSGRASLPYLRRVVLENEFDGGFKIKAVKTADAKPLTYTINKTMMRVNLPEPLTKGASFKFQVEWFYNIHDRLALGGRSGYEYFEKDGNYMYIIAQWFPRMAVYDDVNGWQHKQFLGRGEFALPFGNYQVAITVPADHVVGATGVLQNPAKVLESQVLKNYQKAKQAAKPVIIVSQKMAEAKEKKPVTDKFKTWVFKAENVRDFAWSSSRKYIWDGMNVNIGGKDILAASYYPKEGNPLWEQYSTQTVAHTLRSYSKHTIDYPYPVAASVHGAAIGMEYPMICFNFGRPEEDGTYSPRVKYGMISVIIHEVGHNFFPMIINSDERQWTWLDEGLNTFLQYLTEQTWEKGFPSRRGPAYKIVDYMKGKSENIRPIMTNSESILQFGNNAYGKPAAALNILRETVMGRELFDNAFKTYAQRWAFKHPMPADFFRSMEDASGIDLDWFWKGWFYTTDPVDIALSNVKLLDLDTRNPEVEKPKIAKQEENQVPFIGDSRNKNAYQSMVEKDPSLRDFYNKNKDYRHRVYPKDKAKYESYLKSLGEEEKAALKKYDNSYFYELTFENVGGLLSPIVLEMTFEDDKKEVRYIPAEIWKLNDKKVHKVFVTQKPVKQFSLDPYRETADINTQNNHFPEKIEVSRFQLYKRRANTSGLRRNFMQEAQKAKKK